jgi:hypothetical protein
MFRAVAPASIEEYSRVRQARQAFETAATRAQNIAAQRPATSRVNVTDPASQIMPGKHDGYGQRHNIQALACKNQFIIAIGTHHSSTDSQALTILLTAARANLDTAAISEPIGTALFDNGYASEANFTADLPVDRLLIAVQKEARQTGRLPESSRTLPEAWHEMAEQFTDSETRKLYKRRAAIIEPLFAQLFTRFGRNLHLRGEQVDTELHLWAVTHNLTKISRRRHRNPPG